MAARRCTESWPPPGMARHPRARAPSKPVQKPTKRPKENGKNTRSWTEPRPPQDEAPAPRPPIPRLLRVQPAERRATGARGLMHAHVAREGKREVVAEGGMSRLVAAQLGFHRQRQPEDVVPALEVVGRPRARAPPLARDERVRGIDGARQALEASPLMCPERLGVQSLQTPIVERRHVRSLKRWIFPVAVFGSSETNS